MSIRNIRVQPIGFIRSWDYLKELNLQQSVSINDLEAHNLYSFKIQVMDQAYIIRRRVKDFQQLEQAVKNDPFLFMKHKDVTKESMEDSPIEKQKILFNFLKSVITNEQDDERPSSDVLKFFEISNVQYGDFRKYKECFLSKKAGGRFSESRCTRCGTLWGRWSKRYFYISNNGVMYCKGPYGDRAQMREQLVFDYNFSMKYGKSETGYKRGIKLEFATRHLLLVAPDYFTFTEFLTGLKQAIKECPYMQSHRFNSFAPVQSSSCKWYIDGEDYFNDVMSALLNAKQYVYITDWWMSPDLYLKRPISTDPDDLTNRDSCLELILKKIADSGIIVYILMYQEPFLIKNDSLYTKTRLELMSHNIIIMRHPNQTIPFKWSHHEKIVVIDGQIGFLGGLDLCFGRMDNKEHKLYDLDVRRQYWPGIDYANNRMKDFVNTKESDKSLIQRNEPRMPWHDIAIQVNGQSVSDLVRHFQQYWNHVIISKNFPNREATQVQLVKKISQTNNYIKIADQCQQNQFQQYKNQVVEEFNTVLPESEECKEEQIKNPYRSPENLRQRISSIFPQKKLCNKDFIEILERIDEQNQEEEIPKDNQIMEEPLIQSVFIQPEVKIVHQGGECETQIIRSASNWSIGCSTLNTEFSIHLAYTQLISEAEKFIYIENQFFISSTDRHNVIENKIAEALVRRIKQAALTKQKFKVIVFLPLLPGFEGDIDTPLLKIQLHWEYFTICRGGQSIIEQLSKDSNIPDPSEYIEFYSLRNHAKILDVPKTEQIYIHSKLMIIDDEYALIGSANINDRSLLGSRDSEIGIVVFDKNKKQSKMCGENVRRSVFAQELRTSLYMEHFGLSYEQIEDPLSDELQTIIRFNSRQNTHIYRMIFACYPDDQIKTIQEYQNFKKNGDISLYDQYKDKIIGHAVIFPLEFLSKENLTLSITTTAYLVSDITFT